MSLICNLPTQSPIIRHKGIVAYEEIATLESGKGFVGTMYPGVCREPVCVYTGHIHQITPSTQQHD